MLFAHISDPHFGTDEAPVLAALRADLLEQAPELAVLTGDITQRARAGQFAAARAFFDSLAPLPVLAVPGNHDLPLFDLLTRFTRPYRLYRRHIGTDLSPTWENGSAVVLGVNSTRPTRHKHGVLDEELVAAVAARLRAQPQPFRIVAVHHPLAVADPNDAHDLARGAEDALAAWSAAGADLVLTGHIHLSGCFSTGPARRRLIALQAGTAVSARRRGGRPNAYHLVRLLAGAPRRMQVDERHFDTGLAAFVLGRRWLAMETAAGWRAEEVGMEFR